MSNRLHPWRSKPTPEILEILELVPQMKLYLLQEHGPTSFLFKDDSNNKIKVSVGDSLKCSCGSTGGRSEHCEHTLYVLLKIFKKSATDPLTWQQSYLDNELSELVKCRFQSSKSQVEKKAFLQRKPKTKEPAQGASSTKKGIRKEINEEENPCPVCQEELHDTEPLTFCKVKCGNNFHISCVRVWAEHKRSIKEQITCPMCRCDWGPRALEEINKDFEEFTFQKLTHRLLKCAECKKKPIRGTAYHCLLCENRDLCKSCFEGWAHFEHNRFLQKERIDTPWEPAPSRERLYLKNKGDVSSFQRNPLVSLAVGDANSAAKALTAVYNFTNGEFQLEKPNETSEELAATTHELPDIKDFYKKNQIFLLQSLPLMREGVGPSQAGQEGAGGLSIVGIDISKNKNTCVSCGRGDDKVMSRLPCGHGIDNECFLLYCQKGIYECPKDGTFMIKGLKSIFEKEGKTQKKLKDDNSQAKQKEKTVSIKPYHRLSTHEKINENIEEEEKEPLEQKPASHHSNSSKNIKGKIKTGKTKEVKRSTTSDHRTLEIITAGMGTADEKIKFDEPALKLVASKKRPPQNLIPKGVAISAPSASRLPPKGSSVIKEQYKENQPKSVFSPQDFELIGKNNFKQKEKKDFGTKLPHI